MKNALRLSLFITPLMVASVAMGQKICVDPGHGGTDPGAVGGSQNEKTNNLAVGLKFRDWLNSDTADTGGGGSWTVLMTRSSDITVSLTARTNYANANSAARFMSIHNNACGSCGATGTETYSYTSNNPTSNDLRNKVQSRAIAAWGLTNRGNKTANFHVLRESNMPAELAELGFIDTAGDRNYLGNATHQNTMGRAHLYAIQTHYGLSAYTPGSSPSLPTYVDDTPSVSSNWAVATSASDKYGSNYYYRSTTPVSDPASWTMNVGTAGTYRIQAWWPAGTNRSTAAPYILPNSATVNVNQQANGGKWNTLGTISLGTGNRTTQLSCWAASGYVVIADAVRYTP